MKLLSMTLLASAVATTTFGIAAHGFSSDFLSVLFAPEWIFVLNFFGVFLSLYVQESVGWSWLSSAPSFFVLCTLGNWLVYFLLAKVVLFLTRKFSQNNLHARHIAS
jgi:hypothetical protein